MGCGVLLAVSFFKYLYHPLRWLAVGAVAVGICPIILKGFAAIKNCLGIAGHPLVWAAVLADVGTCLVVIFNSMLILKGTQKHGGKCCKSSAQSRCHKEEGKCCESLASSHTHKHGGNNCKSSHVHQHGTDSDHCHPSHNQHQQRCCEDNNSQKACEPKQSSPHGCATRCDTSPCSSNNSRGCATRCDTSPCSSNNSCGNNQYTVTEKKHCDHGSCKDDHDDIEAQNTHIHVCSSVQTQDHCHHGHSDNETQENKPNHLHHSTCMEEDGRITIHGHCHPEHCSENHVASHTDNELGKVIENNCAHHKTGLHRRACCGSTSDIPPGTVAMNGCLSLEKTEISACCKSCYMKHCSAKHGHLGAGFGGLTEIVTE